MRSAASKYQIIQLGLCFFLKNAAPERPDSYGAYPFNVYLFPEERPGTRRDVVLDIDTVNFHKQQKLDFNKWIYEGVPYISAKTEKLMAEKFMVEKSEAPEELHLCESDVKKMEQEVEKIKKWIEEGGKEEHVISGLNSFLRKYLYQEIAKKFPQLHHKAKQQENFQKQIILKIVTAEEKKAIEEAEKKEKLQDMEKRSGALRLLKLLASLKVPIVGHNPIYDLMFIYSHFIGELPFSWQEFKQEIHCLFPDIYDTMIIFGDDKVKKLLPEKQSSGLEAVYLFVSANKELPDIPISIELDNKYSKAEHYHEAGYDAYITGFNFIRLLGYIGPENSSKYKNQLYSHRSPFNFNIEGKEALHDNVSSAVRVATGLRGPAGQGKNCRQHQGRAEGVQGVVLYEGDGRGRDLLWDKETGVSVEAIYRGCEKIVEALKSLPEITAVQEWDAYVEIRKGLIGLEEKKEMTDIKWDSKSRKETLEPSAAPQRPKMAEHSKPYTAPQYYCYPSQTYQYPHVYNYPRPPYQ